MCIAKALFLQEDRAKLVTCFQEKLLTKLLSDRLWSWVNGKEGIPNPPEGGYCSWAELSTLTLNQDQALYLAKD